MRCLGPLTRRSQSWAEAGVVRGPQGGRPRGDEPLCPQRGSPSVASLSGTWGRAVHADPRCAPPGPPAVPTAPQLGAEPGHRPQGGERGRGPLLSSLSHPPRPPGCAQCVRHLPMGQARPPALLGLRLRLPPSSSPCDGAPPALPAFIPGEGAFCSFSRLLPCSGAASKLHSGRPGLQG